MTLITISTIFLAFLLGFLLAYLLVNREKNTLKALYEEKLSELLKEITPLKQLETEYAVLSARYEDEQQSHGILTEKFENLAQRIFDQKSKSFDEHNEKKINLMLQPFREQIESFSKISQARYEDESKERHLLKAEILNLQEINKRISDDALNLTKALKGENKTQGNWGEIVLERILEDSGLREGHEYITQSSYRSNEGKLYRPDVIINLPQDKQIIVDSKVSLTAYERYVNSSDVYEKSLSLKEHLLSIQTHIKELSQKSYEDLEGIHTLDFTLLFMPIEGSFLLALQEDPSFFKQAYEKNIMVVSPSTLLVTLRTIEHIWRNERQEQHAQEIASKAEGLYEKLVLFVEDMDKIGDQLTKSQDTYEKAMSRLNSGKGNLIRRAEQMRELGLKPKKQMPDKHLGESSDH